VQHVDSKMSFIRFTRTAKIDPDDQRPSAGAPPDPSYAPPRPVSRPANARVCVDRPCVFP
jgi:hypothetical protein